MGSLVSQRAPRLRSGLTRETQYRRKAAAYMQHLRVSHSPVPPLERPLESPQRKVPLRFFCVSKVPLEASVSAVLSLCRTLDVSLWLCVSVLGRCQTSTLTLPRLRPPFHVGSWGVINSCSLLHWPSLPPLG